MFKIIGERLNMTRKGIKERVWDRDEEFIISEVNKQIKAGATYIDVNAGGDPKKEIEDMVWLAGVVSKVTKLPLVFDSLFITYIVAGKKTKQRIKKPSVSITDAPGQCCSLKIVAIISKSNATKPKFCIVFFIILYFLLISNKVSFLIFLIPL